MPSQAPTAPPCPHYPQCVACAYVGLPYGEQLARKRQRVRETLARHPSLAHVEVPPLVKSRRSFGYRNQAKLVARRTRRGVLLGVYRPGTHRVVDIRACPVHHPLLRDTVAAIGRLCESRQVPIYDERTGEGWLRYVIARMSQRQRSLQIILVVRDTTWPGEKRLVQKLRGLRCVRSVVVNLNADPGNAIFGPRFVARAGPEALIERVGAVELKTRAGSFLQANIETARRVYEQVLRWANPGPQDDVADLYCGVGAISLLLAPHARRVTGIEASERAVRDAKENIRLNGVHNLRFVAGNAATALPALVERTGLLDVITLNPPRKGAGEDTIAAIVRASPSRIVYVSCNPETLARDLDRLAEHGYRAESVQPFDMLPQTDHVECVALLCRGKGTTGRGSEGVVGVRVRGSEGWGRGGV